MKVGYFPYRPGGNPYQSLFAKAIESTGVDVTRIPPEKWFPLQKMARVDADVFQLDWPHDWYRGRNPATSLLKQIMYSDGLRKLRKHRVVWTAHNLVAHDADNEAFEKRMIQRLIDVVDGIIVLSAVSEQALREAYRVSADVKVEVIHHGHYMDVYPAESTRSIARSKLQIDEGRKVVLHLGRLLPYKGIEDLVEAFAEIELDNSLLLIAGSCISDDYRLALEKLVFSKSSENAAIKLVPEFIAEENMQHFYAAADVVALPFRHILNSGSLLAAMSFGKCVVAPDIGSIREIACPEGWFSYQHDKQLGEALEAALNCGDIEPREKLVAQFTRDAYSWHKVGEKAVSLYRNILG